MGLKLYSFPELFYPIVIAREFSKDLNSFYTSFSMWTNKKYLSKAIGLKKNSIANSFNKRYQPNKFHYDIEIVLLKTNKVVINKIKIKYCIRLRSINLVIKKIILFITFVYNSDHEYNDETLRKIFK